MIIINAKQKKKLVISAKMLEKLGDSISDIGIKFEDAAIDENEEWIEIFLTDVQDKIEELDKWVNEVKEVIK